MQRYLKEHKSYQEELEKEQAKLDTYVSSDDKTKIKRQKDMVEEIQTILPSLKSKIIKQKMHITTMLEEYSQEPEENSQETIQ